MKTQMDILYGDSSPLQALNVYLPDGKVEGVFVYFHGGGFERGDKERGDFFAPQVTMEGIAVVSCNYRMYPDAKFPDFIRDAAACVKWTWDRLATLFDSAPLYVGGSSAGGYLSMMLCFDKRWLGEVGMGAMDIAGFLHDAGQPTTHFRVLKERGIDPRRIIVDEDAPLFHIGTQEELPPMRFLVSDEDMQNRLEQLNLVLSTLNHFEFKRYDVQLQKGKHCAYCRPREDGTARLGDLILDFIAFVKEKRA